ncbi:MAG: hypothetical protein SOH81_07825 [Acetobacter sp.]|jgi:hypothetical protein
MKKATTTHNPDRVIAYSLSGPVYAPDHWSDEQAKSLRKRIEAASLAIRPCLQVSNRAREEFAKLLSRELLAGQSRNACYPGHGLRSWLLFLPYARSGLAFRELVTCAQTSLREKVSAYRISMVVVAIAMVVALRALVNRRSQHGGAA